jgi:ribosomal protein L11 methyltransferase
LLDVGCGSGVLALLAAHKGVELVAGLDIDGRAIAMSRKNAEENHLAGRAHWLVGTIAAIGRTFECVVANLPYAVLAGILDDLERAVEPRGALILSGFHDIQWHEFGGNLARMGFTMERIASGDQSFYGPPPSGSYTWMAVRMRKGSSRQPSPGS